MTDRKRAIETTDGRVDAFLFTPDGPGSWPAVILHADIRGVRPAFEAHGRRLAALGYAVLLPNLFYRVGPAPVFDPALSLQEGRGQARMAEIRGAVSVAGLHRDHAAFLDFLAREPQVKQDRVAIVGYCMSGAVALRTAADFSDRIAAAASFHGGRLATDAPDSPHLRADDIRAALYFGYAKDDNSMSPAMIEQLESALQAANVRFQSDHFEAKHGFAVLDSASYDESAAERHWVALTAFLKEAFEAS